jgi:hypothetical protein
MGIWEGGMGEGVRCGLGSGWWLGNFFFGDNVILGNFGRGGKGEMAGGGEKNDGEGLGEEWAVGWCQF